MTKLLISFCNVYPSGLGLGIFDFETDDFQWVDLSSIKSKVYGVTGTTFHDGKYWFLTQESGNSGLYVLDKNFVIKESYSLHHTRDAHSIIPHDDGFLVNDTLKNRINKVTISQKKDEVKETEFWKYNNDPKDTVHLNSIIKLNGKFFASLFGYKSGDDWKTAVSGKIIQIPENKIIINDLLQPHTICHDNESLYFLESKNSSIHKISKDGSHEVIVKIEGYARGMTFDEKYFYVGSSARRLKSKSLGTINPEETKDPDRYHSWLYRINRKTLEIERKDLTVFGAEIYDLILLNHDYNIQNKVNPIILRMWKYEIEHLAYQDAIDSLQQMVNSNELSPKKNENEIRQKEKIIGDYKKELESIKKGKTWKILQKYVKFKKKFKN